jgi:CO/xanthine dehydrogenase Mo-binding subunit
MVSVTLGVPFDRIFVAPTNTDVLPNGGSGVTGGSVASEACCEAARLACEELLERMGWNKKNDDGETVPPTLDELNRMVIDANGLFGVKEGNGGTALGGEAFDAHLKALLKGPMSGTSSKTTKVNLTAVGVFNPDFTGDGRIFNDLGAGDVLTYHTLGAACTEVELDVLTGETAVVRCKPICSSSPSAKDTRTQHCWTTSST